ncbi:MAG: class I SAM-dependent methyltransferase, partial [Acidobacteriota bacterium]
MTPHKVGEIYDAWSSYQNTRLDAFPCEFHIHRALLHEHLPPGSRVLDVGAGPGRYAIELSRAGHRVVAGDVSPVQVDQARRNVAEAGLAIEPRDEVTDGVAGDSPSAGVESV